MLVSTMAHRIARALARTLVVVLCASRAEASVSAPRASIDADAASLQAIVRETGGPAGCTAFVLESDAVVVREYLSSSGVVFAVTWAGLAHPDLDVLLGPHARAWRAAARSTAAVRGQRSRRIATEDVVVETWGHMRHLQGRAYAPALVPYGVAVDELP